MVRRIAMLWIGIFLLMLPLSVQGQTKKYGLKSGIVTFEFIIIMGDMEVKQKQIVFFDDYGLKECKESYEGTRLNESFFSDGTSLYKAVHSEKAVYNVGKAYRGTELKFDWNEVSERDKKAGKAKKIANMTIADKTCEAYEYDDRRGKTIFAGWNGLTLLTDHSSDGIRSVTRATKIEENVEVSAEKFRIPPGYAVKKM